MVRPVRPRFVRGPPWIDYFKPRGIPLSGLAEVILKLEEIEAIRLKDWEELDQENCAKKMKISRGTFQRVLNSAKKKIADALVNGKAIRVEGGNYKMPTPITPAFGAGRGRGRFGAGGPPTVCVCSACGNQQPKVRGVPCAQMKCEKCGAPMIRGD